MNNIEKVVKMNYKLQLDDLKKRIENKILILKDSSETQYNKDNALRELETFFWREVEGIRQIFWTANKFWIDFLTKGLFDVSWISAKEMPQLSIYKNKVFLEEFSNNEEIFDSLDRKIHRAIKDLTELNLISIKSIKRKPWYYWNIIKQGK